MDSALRAIMVTWNSLDRHQRLAVLAAWPTLSIEIDGKSVSVNDVLSTANAMVPYGTEGDDHVPCATPLELVMAQNSGASPALICMCAPGYTPRDVECLPCGVDECPYCEPLHYHHDGCPACDFVYAANEQPREDDIPRGSDADIPWRPSQDSEGDAMKVQDPRLRDAIMRLVDLGHARLAQVDSHQYEDDIGVAVHFINTYADKIQDKDAEVFDGQEGHQRA